MNVLVTGGGSGIGLACAESFYRDGANVALMGRSDIRLAEARSALESIDAPGLVSTCLLYTSPSPRDATLSRMPSSA